MQIRLRDAALVIATTAIVVGGALAVMTVPGLAPNSQGGSPQPRRTADGKPEIIERSNRTVNVAEGLRAG